jgi:hypothetical protein
MTGKPRPRTIGALIVVAVALWAAQSALDGVAAARSQGAAQAPRYEVDPFWPKPLPNHWVLGNAIGVWVDARDNVWIVHRGSDTLAANEKALELKAGDCCAGAPGVLAFDKAGTLIQRWGGPGQGYDWPDSNHGIFVDHTGMVWIGGNGPGDSHIMKFTQDGKFVAQYGKPNARMTGKNEKGQPTFTPGSSDQESFGRVAKIFVEPKANEA